MTAPDTLRAEIDAALATGAWQAARSLLVELWARETNSATAGFVVSRFERLREHVRFTPLRLAILRSFTVEPLVPLLRASAFAAGIDLSVKLGEFNAYAQEILDPGSRLYEFQPHAAILAVQTGDIAAELWTRYADLEPAEVSSAVERVATQFADWIGALRARSQAHLVVHSLEMPCDPANGVFDTQAETGQTDAIAGVNRRLRQVAREHRGVYVLDYDALVARHGRGGWRDERKWLTVRMPIAAANLPHLAREWMRFLQPLAGRTAKVAVVDLDNTLWGGVIGEDGIDRIQVGAEHPGAAYQAIQRALLDLRRRGVMLAVASKNNPADAMDALEKHPGMLLRPAHFSALRINWNSKAQSLREIAEELSVGIDALAFIDDNPAERRQVRGELPDVTVLELSADVAGWAHATRTHPAFERLSLVEEDRQRAGYYAAERERCRLEEALPTREDFYRSLAQVAEIEPLNSGTLPRVAQLSQKTNQFNLTTRRYTEQQLSEMAPGRPGTAILAVGRDGQAEVPTTRSLRGGAEDAGATWPEHRQDAGGTWHIFSLRVRDRYADNGIVGVAILALRDGVCEIDTLLLSCRVIGRTVETAFLSWLAGWSRRAGAASLRGWFYPTAKNAPARSFYALHGFEQVSQTTAGTLWALDLAKAGLRCPEWITLQGEEEIAA